MSGDLLIYMIVEAVEDRVMGYKEIGNGDDAQGSAQGQQIT